MHVFLNQLDELLKQSLRPVYVVGGSEEVLQIGARDQIVSAVKRSGIEDATIHHADEVRSNSAKNAIWHTILDELSEGSIFGASRLIEVRTTASVFANKGWDFIRGYLDNPSDSNVLLISLSAFDRREKRKKWYNELRNAKELIFLTTDEPTRQQFIQWIQSVAQEKGFELDSTAAEKLADMCEGNLLAAKQELDVLGLVTEPGKRIHAAELQISDLSRSESFALLDAVCAGSISQISKLLDSVRRQGNWRTNVEMGILRLLSSVLTLALESALDESKTIPGYQSRRVSSLKNRFSQSEIEGLLTECAQINSVALGMARGEVYLLIKGLLYSVAGYSVSHLERDYPWRMIDRT